MRTEQTYTTDEAERLLNSLEAGIPPEIAYATLKTERMVTEENVRLLSEEDFEEWQEAVKEYEKLKPH